jgi:hypothetical protein
MYGDLQLALFLYLTMRSIREVSDNNSERVDIYSFSVQLLVQWENSSITLQTERIIAISIWNKL